MLYHLLFSNVQSDQYSLSHCEKIPNFRHYFTATQWILIGSQIREEEVKEHANLYLLYIYHNVIRSELKYLIGANVLSSLECGTGQKTVDSVRIGVLMR